LNDSFPMTTDFKLILFNTDADVDVVWAFLWRSEMFELLEVES